MERSEWAEAQIVAPIARRETLMWCLRSSTNNISEEELDQYFLQRAWDNNVLPLLLRWDNRIIGLNSEDIRLCRANDEDCMHGRVMWHLYCYKYRTSKELPSRQAIKSLPVGRRLPTYHSPLKHHRWRPDSEQGHCGCICALSESAL